MGCSGWQIWSRLHWLPGSRQGKATTIFFCDSENKDYSQKNKKQSNKEATLNLVFDIAEKKLGIPRLFEPSDLIEGNPDERSVILYSSLFYHAWTTNEERIRLANESRGLGSKMSEVKLQLAQQEEERQKLQRERDMLKEETAKRGAALSEEEERIRRLEADIAALKASAEDIKKRLQGQLQDRQSSVHKH